MNLKLVNVKYKYKYETMKTKNWNNKEKKKTMIWIIKFISFKINKQIGNSLYAYVKVFKYIKIIKSNLEDYSMKRRN